MTQPEAKSQVAAPIPFRALEDGTFKRLLMASGSAVLLGAGLTLMIGGVFQAVVFAVSSIWILAFLGLSVWAIKLFLFDNNRVMGFLAVILKLNTMFLMMAFLFRVYKMMESGKIGSPGPALLAGVSVPLVVLLVYALTKLPQAHQKPAAGTGKEIHG